MVPDMDTTEFVKKLKLSLIKNKYPSIPYYNVNRGKEDFQLLPSVIDDFEEEVEREVERELEQEQPRRKKFKSYSMQRRYDELNKKMHDLLEQQRRYDAFEKNIPSRSGVERRNSF